MKKVAIYFLFMLAFAFKVNAQTGIGTTTPDASAKLDVSSANKGFLPPRVTLTNTTDNTTIPNPATGLLVYNTGTNPNLVAGYYYWNGSNWATIATATGSGVSSSYVRGSRTSAQTTGLSTNGLVAFTQVDQSAGQDISLNTSTGQITLAAGRTYRLQAQVPSFQTSASDARPQFGWYNETTGAYVGSSSSSYSGASNAGYGATGGLSDAVITTSVQTVVSYRIIQTFNTNQLGGNIDFTATGSYPWFNIEVISGNQPIQSDKIAKFVNESVPVILGDIQVQMAPNGLSRSLQIKTTGSSFVGMVSAYTTYNGASGTNSFTYFSDITQNVGSTFAHLGTTWGFAQSGDVAVYYLRDTTNFRFYRITLMVGPSYFNNMISIEKLI
jgi:hypothetical protein